MTDELQPPTDELDWDGVNRWREVLEDDFDPGEWVQATRGADGIIDMGYVTLSDAATAFVRDLYDLDVIAGFDWGAWMQRRGRELFDQPELVSGASLDDCRRLLIALVRGDRFNEGVLLQAFRDGTVLRILTRTAELAAG